MSKNGLEVFNATDEQVEQIYAEGLTKIFEAVFENPGYDMGALDGDEQREIYEACIQVGEGNLPPADVISKCFIEHCRENGGLEVYGFEQD